MEDRPQWTFQHISATYKGKGGRGKGNKGYKGKQQRKGYIGKGYGHNEPGIQPQ
jgi:hypothetical protein